MNTTRLTQFRQAFASYDWTPAQRRKYARAWARSLRLLGDKWLGVPSVTKQPETKEKGR